VFSGSYFDSYVTTPALHRTTLASVHTQPSLDAGRSYKTPVTDQYSRIPHSFEVESVRVTLTAF